MSLRATDTLSKAVGKLLGERTGDGHWVGELSSSALSTATASCALALYRRARPSDPRLERDLVAHGVSWIARHQNTDGGWGDTVDSPSNISTTVLCWVALGVDDELARRHADAVTRAEAWICRHAGGLSPDRLSACLVDVYGDDRTFSIPILTMCALGGRFGDGAEAWRWIQPIPFELGAVPHRWLHRLGVPMVSYALPALIAIGQVNYHHRPPRNPLTRTLRALTRERTLQVLEGIQPSGGGFLEAAPLTSFVSMSLIGCERADHPVVDRAVGFLARTVRDDGSWPIDTNLATWLTTLSVNALARGGTLNERLGDAERSTVLGWLLDQQYRTVHPYTNAAPGGWAWTDLDGGVPDADDTAGALIAIRHLSGDDPGRCVERAWEGIGWLLGLQNRDGGIPTFCRGWGKLPFDRSSPDLTAHALRAWQLWLPELSPERRAEIELRIAAAVRYLLRNQESSGAWIPLWFGNQSDPDCENPLYGTTRVLLARGTRPTNSALAEQWSGAMRRAEKWLLDAQGTDGGWGGGPGIEPSIEETSLALEALAGSAQSKRVQRAVERGMAWLDRASTGGRTFQATPIGLYFARLWYSERLYPTIFTVSALGGLRAQAAKVEPRAAGRGA